MSKRILLIIPELTVGGAQRSLAALSIYLSKNHTVIVVVFNQQEGVDYAVGGSIISLNVQPGKSWFTKLFTFFLRVYRLKRIKQKERIQVAISFLEGADYVNVLSKGSERVILSIRGSKIHDEIMNSYFRFLRAKLLIPWLYSVADAIVTVNHGIYIEMIKVYKLSESKIKVIPNFYELDKIRVLSSADRSNKWESFYRSPILITSGRLSQEKGLSALVLILSCLKSTGMPAKLVMIGDGPERERLKKLAIDLGLKISIGEPNSETDLVFVGHQKNVYSYLRGASLYLMNSSSEGFPNGMLEAMICNVPILSSDCPYGPREILAPELPEAISETYFSKYGILMPFANKNTDIQLWTRVIHNFLKDGRLQEQLKTQASLRAGDFAVERVTHLWDQVIHG